MYTVNILCMRECVHACRDTVAALRLLAYLHPACVLVLIAFRVNPKSVLR